ncbi:Stk1 family PASTA domain-containing Ser/Thr kinase [Fictibacillus enclensis]|uniref:Stk1 family PASTA domain-containing Ser/Thr kinase n=1 Tax=Fictibacillus enclensis TaxID=1017270 RepID=UPI0025A0B6E8|nr:Stk1 family PASTA domain-containing Ser/Thr kinase [Fictibacillus enclensis]MDM5198822.1 Stk1 family PASTA domain-containing Ser/Thr kinase [Fictibacillus enclensis]
MIGKRISGRYKLLEVIGDGGMAIVYRAKDLILDRDVAVKILRSEFSDDEEFIKRFKREAEAATSLDHPHIVSIFDVGEENNVYFIVMEYVKGKTLKQYIREKGRLSVEESIQIIKQIASGMVAAHEHGIIHRDIKPHNILIDENGVAKVTDFGIALAITSATITHTNSVLGSVHYFSPEQARGGVANAKSDIYSLGVVLFEMLTGRVPFTGESPVSVALKHLQEDVPEPRKINPEIPQSVENIILKALTKNPVYRYDSALEMMDDLDTALSPHRLNEDRWSNFDESADATRIMAPVSMTKEAEAKEPEPKPDQPPAPKKKKKKWRMILLILILLLAVAGVAAFVMPGMFKVKDVSVPNVVHKDYADGYDKLVNLKLKVERKDLYDDEVEQGKIVKQDPEAQSMVKEGSTVTLYVSKGFKKVDMEDLTGMKEEEARDLLNEKGYNTKNIETIPVESEETPEGEVVSQSPEKGEKVNPSEIQVILRVSTGPPTVQLENLANSSKEDVQNYISQEGLNVDFSEEYSDSVEEGKVISQKPSPYTTVKKGSTVNVVISKGKKPEPKPPEEKPEEKPEDKPEKPDSGEEPQDQEITFNNKITVEVSKEDEDQQFQVRIVYSDAKKDNAVFVEEQISKTKEYMVPLTVSPEKDASYTVYLNGKEQAAKTFNYKDAKEGNFKGENNE